MPTDFFLRSAASGLGGAGQRRLSQRRGRASATFITSTTAGGTNIITTATAGGQALSWFSEPVTEAITISGTITVNIRGLEAANSVNAGRGILIERCNNAGVVQSTILVDSTVPATITEYTTTDAANGAATYTATSTAMAVGERIKVTLKVRNVGTMGANASGVTNSHDGPAAGAAGDTWVRFTQDIITDEVLEVGASEIYGAGIYG
jgi:hypothetical protein